MLITNMLKNTLKHNKFETLIYSQREEEIERNCEEEREGSLILIFLPINFKIVRMLSD